MPSYSRNSSVELDPMTILQNRWYNTLTRDLHLDQGLFQIHQSFDSIIRSNKNLWMIQNIIPPLSLTFNSSICLPELFSDEYATTVSQLQYPENKFREDIGEEIYQKWLIHLRNIVPPPTDNKLPILFRQWSMVSAPSVMSVGVFDLSQMVLINGSLKSIQAYFGLNPKVIDFNSDYAKLIKTLNNSSGKDFIFDSNLSAENIVNTWANSNQNELFGLWAGCCSKSRINRKFSLSHVKVNVTIKSYTVYTSIPGSWYNSSLLNTAYTVQDALPWPKKPNPTWENVFGDNGSMQRLIISLVVADGINVTISSSANYCAIDQQTIHNNIQNGVWPFYVPTNNSTATNVSTFDNIKGMKIETVTQPGNPLVIGNNSLPIAQYLGHAIP